MEQIWVKPESSIGDKPLSDSDKNTQLFLFFTKKSEKDTFPHVEVNPSRI